MQCVALAGIAILGLPSFAAADSVGYEWVRQVLHSGRAAVDLYVKLSSPSSRVMMISAATFSTTAPGGFYQSPEHPFWQPGVQHAATAEDSLVTIGTSPSGSGNTSPTIVVPLGFYNFNDADGATDFSYIGTTEFTATWHIPPANTQWGYPVQGRVHVARFIVDSPTACDTIDATFDIVWKSSNGLTLVAGGGASNLPVLADFTCGGECASDFDGSGDVDGEDLGILLGDWGRSGPGDLNGDGEVNGEDLGILLSAWGACP